MLLSSCLVVFIFLAYQLVFFDLILLPYLMIICLVDFIKTCFIIIVFVSLLYAFPASVFVPVTLFYGYFWATGIPLTVPCLLAYREFYQVFDHIYLSWV